MTNNYLNTQLSLVFYFLNKQESTKYRLTWPSTWEKERLGSFACKKSKLKKFHVHNLQRRKKRKTFIFFGELQIKCCRKELSQRTFFSKCVTKSFVTPKILISFSYWKSVIVEYLTYFYKNCQDCYLGVFWILEFSLIIF